jgi:3-methyladenine DNA glycosylase AlkD
MENSLMRSSAWCKKCSPRIFGAEQRCIAKHYKALPIEEIAKLLASRIHEHRLTGLLILVERFSGSKEAVIRREIVDFYLANLKQVNNWDLVDLSAPKILGEHYSIHPLHFPRPFYLH